MSHGNIISRGFFNPFNVNYTKTYKDTRFLMNVYFYTLGCRVNQYETDAARELFIEGGYEITENPEEADICVVNTCSVTGEADRKSRQQLRKMARINPDTIVVAMGCAVEVANGKVDGDVLVGTRDKNKVVTIVEEYIKTNSESNREVWHTRPEVTRSDVYHEFGTVLSPEGTRAFVKIEDGCNKFCSYCIIPYARGRVASRSRENVVKEVVSLAESGFSEVVISGIHLCSYGKDRGEDIMSLLSLLKEIDSIDGINRIRLGSLEPKSMTREFIDGLATISKLCPHFHLSLQSGSDTVLSRMNRDYTSEEYLERVNLLREKFPTMALTTDIICGFPGETDEEFAETLAFVEKAGFTKVHVFPYSLREGTKAAKMEQLPSGVGKKRANELILWSDRKESEFASSFVGSRRSVLIEREISSNDSIKVISGYTPEYVRAEITISSSDNTDYKGKLVEFDVTSADGCTIKGSIN